MGLLKRLRSHWMDIFGTNTPGNIGIYGPPNGGKTTLTNQIISDCTDMEDVEELLGSASSVAHETREAKRQTGIPIEHNGSSIEIDIVDTPGVTSQVNFNEFLDDDNFEGTEEEAIERSREATKGVEEAIGWLREDIDGVIYVVDATKNPFTQINNFLKGMIKSHDIPAIVLANKIDLDGADVKQVENAFSDNYEIIPVSAKTGENMDEVYRAIAETMGDN